MSVLNNDGFPATAGCEAPECPDLKARLLRAVHAAEPAQVEELLDHLWSSGLFRIKLPPKTGLIMSGIRDPFDTIFHLGEILVSHAEVDCNGKTGCGVICGDEPEKAWLLAAVAAAQLGSCAALLDRVGGAIGSLEKKLVEQQARMARLAAATQVRFDSMKKENVDFGSLGE